ncbi:MULTISPECIES: SMI1/KNR4 family protein [unclassified Pseudoalteromonas]|uniref:SMI1/KNR4 family protein n=1 Tax=unclassified Pseudoalteromonas TaxID=194690 RepID=UPI0015FF909D|nr:MULTISPECIES: SMI1/KNR4 family protein [unclassified Pseudoalteromonas]MBB1335078.1 SMI1/KNR4 family protein [Pseudoalteromonas sp. SR41-6]MBB1343245.1 SMI1/KNR4 family protein [Pseudoalteromonas sp. SR45-6]MBB1460500.1 SMI1/KNR4 family protein [Pseudoalteromonas sp. SG41-8]
MKNLDLKKKVSVTHDELYSLEMFFNINLPISYREFILEFNGASPEEAIIRINSEERVLERFLIVSEDEKLDSGLMQYEIKVVMAQIEERLTANEDLVGAETLPFAFLFGGDFLCLDFKEDAINPKVVIWDHNESEELSPVFYKAFDNFQKFLNAMSFG